MEDVKCNVIRDLLPLYADNIASEESAELCRKHLEHCDECRRVFEGMNTDTGMHGVEDDGVALKQVKRQIRKRRFHSTVLWASLAMLILTVFFSWLTKPQYLSWSEDIAEVTVLSEDEVRIDFKEPVTAYEETVFSYDGYMDCVSLSARTSRWERLLGTGAPSVTVQMYENTAAIFYSKADEEAVLLYQQGDGIELNGSYMEQSRLVIGVYFILCFIVLVPLAILHIILRKRRAGTVLGAIALYPAVWMVSSLANMGFNLSSSDSGRDFMLISFTALLMWAAVRSIVRLVKLK